MIAPLKSGEIMDKFRVCTMCKEKKSVDNFYKQTLGYHSLCNPCKTKYNKQRYAKQKKALSFFKGE
tara:strand:+ start:1579 stop:1776 length:198 start_codon:yes stop_codon:yes gene_type:complete